MRGSRHPVTFFFFLIFLNNTNNISTLATTTSMTCPNIHNHNAPAARTGAREDQMTPSHTWCQTQNHSWVTVSCGEVFIMPLWFLSESSHSCGIQWNPAELFLAESPAKIAIPGTIYSSGIEPFQNWDRNRIWQNAVCINDKSTMHTPSGMFSSHRGVHRVLKMTWQWVSWVHGPQKIHVTWHDFYNFWISNLSTLVILFICT